MINRTELKLQAKDLIRSGVVSPLLISAILIVVTSVLDDISLWFSSGTTLLRELERAWSMGMDYVPTSAPADPTIAATFVPVLIALLSTVLYAGYSSYCMAIRRREEAGVSSLLDGLGVAGKVIWCDIQMSLRVTLWSMLFVIPGVIALYRYRFAMYNILRDPSLSAGQAIALSCRQTEGMKMELFLLDLSFIGWHLGAIATLGLLNIWVLPYTRLTDLGYYEIACQRTGDPTPDRSQDHTSD